MHRAVGKGPVGLHCEHSFMRCLRASETHPFLNSPLTTAKPPSPLITHDNQNKNTSQLRRPERDTRAPKHAKVNPEPKAVPMAF